MRKHNCVLITCLLFLLMCATAHAQLVLNEFQADPASGLDGDANGDGMRDGSEDEFVELVNTSGGPLDISSWTLSDGASARHVFPAGTILPDLCSVVVFGGGSPVGLFGNSTVQVASTGLLGLNNTGDSIIVNDGLSNVIDVAYGNEANNNQSLTRVPDIVGAMLVEHSTAMGSGGSLFSPGTQIDGSLLSGCPDDVPPQVQSITPADMQSDVDPATSIDVVFTEGVLMAADAITVQCTSGTQTFPAMGQVLVTLSVDPADFAFDDVCTVTIDASLVSDIDGPSDPLDGNGDGTGGDDFVSTFTVMSDPAPTVASTTPAEGTSGHGLSDDIIINFSEPVIATQFAPSLSCNGVPVPFAPVMVIGGSVMTINPDNDLVNAAMCTVTLDATQVQASTGIPDNLDGNGDGIPGDDFVLTFTAGIPVLEIFEIQGDGLASAFDGMTVTTNDNIVTVLDINGFYIQTPDARDDGDVNTSNALFVFTGGAPTVAVGDQVDITAELVEFNELTEFGSPGSQIINIDSSGNPLPTAVTFDATLPSPDPTFEYCNTDLATAKFECLENMLIDVPQAFVSAPYAGFFSNTQRNDILVIRAGSERGFREPGVEFPGLGGGIPTWDGNPELFEVFMPGLTLSSISVPGGSEMAIQGVIFQFGNDYQINPSVLDVINENTLPVAVPATGSEIATVASANLFRLFNDVNDPGDEDDDQTVTTQEYQDRLAKISRYFREDLNAPDIITVEEVERLDVLNDLAARITADDATIVYTAELVEGNDRGGIDVGYLYRSNVTSLGVTQLGAMQTLSVDGSLLHDRPPLHLRADIAVTGGSVRVNLLAIHTRSRGGIDDVADGARVRQKRLEQANSIAMMIQDIETANPGESVIALGDFNAFQFTDGYVDVIGQITGTALQSENERWTMPLFVNNPLTQAVSTLPADEQYSFLFGGNAQVLDNALMNSRAVLQFQSMSYARGNADAPLAFEDDNSSSLRSADHDGFVLFLQMPGDQLFEDGFEDQP